ncbi:hypothetical protein [Rodentibacter caecimuris]|uniref:Uncharacterized protein n=1 Tax=Rodentibacter caecimuris TaxID=1796644 RepID=A0ABX3KZQ3_9PAST|nr:hypothetical protein BKG89_07990 [Rodentibacter heylii]
MDKTFFAQTLNNRSILTILFSVLTEQQRKEVLLRLSNVLDKIDDIDGSLGSEELTSLVREDLKNFIDDFNERQ